MGKHGLIRSFSNAIEGLKCTVLNERNMKIHTMAAILALSAGVILGISRLEWMVLILTIFMVLAAELANTAIENTVDMFTRDYNHLAKMAKNAAAGGVLLTAINAVIIAVLIFGPYLKNLL